MKKLCLIIIVALIGFSEATFAQKNMPYYSEINVDSLISATEHLILLPEVKVYSNKRKAARANKKFDKLLCTARLMIVLLAWIQSVSARNIWICAKSR